MLLFAPESGPLRFSMRLVLWASVKT